MNEAEPPRSAGIVSRCVAAVIDLGVVLVIIGLLYVGLILTRLAVNPSAFQLPAIGVLFSTTVTFSISVLYLAGCWAVSGCTVGAVVMGLRVRGRKSERLPGVVALLRAVACVVFPVGLAWVAVDSQRRSLQDLLFRSRVVYVSRPSS
ncbi:MAG: hypothetical protein QOJ80_4612 [Mycobacterium sp.]|nr:hypothetical protein [Mycobacterium sp.]